MNISLPDETDDQGVYCVGGVAYGKYLWETGGKEVVQHTVWERGKRSTFASSPSVFSQRPQLPPSSSRGWRRSSELLN